MADRWMMGDLATLDDYIPTPPTNILGDIAQGVVDYAKRPGQTMAANPYPPGSEEAQFYEDQRRSNTYRIAPETAMNMVGMGTPFAPASALGMAGGKMKTPTVAPGALAATSEYRPPFYSAVEQAVQGAKQNVAPGQQWAGFLRNQPGVKPEEVEALKLGKLFEQPGALSKQAVLGEIAANRVNVGEVYKGGERPTTFSVSSAGNLSGAPALRMDFATAAEANAELARRQASHPGGHHSMAELPTAGSRPKFEQYTLPGGENYREMLLTLPEQKGSGFDPAKVELRRKQQSTTQGSTIVSYDGKNIGTFDDPPQLNLQTGQYAQRPDQYWIDIMRRRYGGDPQMGIKPLDQGVNFRSSHYDEPNILAHVRYNDRVIDGKKTLFVEEVQSDWHQKGKREGYGTAQEPGKVAQQGNHAWRVEWADGSYAHYSSEAAAQEAATRRTAAKGGVPDAPFKTTWPELAMKRIIREAAEKGYDKVAWTPGSVQAARYPEQLRQHVDNISWSSSGLGGAPRPDGSRSIQAMPRNSNTPLSFIVSKDGVITDAVDSRARGQHVEDLFGKDMARQIMDKPSGDIASKDFVIGAKGMQGFYDEILPATVNRLVKKHGGRVQQDALPTNKEGWHITPPEQTTHGRWMVKSKDYTSRGLQFDTEAEAQAALASKMTQNQVHTLDITPSLRAAAMKGFPLFSAGGVAATGAMGELARQDEYR